MVGSKMTKRDKLVFIAFLAFFILAVPLAYLGTFYSAHKGTHSGGTIIDGKYYYEIAGKGIYEYTPGKTSKRIIKNRNMYTDYLVNQDGIYHSDGKMIYFYDFETSDNTLFFDGGRYDITHISFNLMTDNNINIVLHNKDKRSISQLVLQSKTANVITPITEPVADPHFHRYAYTDFYIGERHIAKKAIGEPYGNSYWLLEENGQNILPDDMVVDDYSGHKSDDCLVFGLYTQNYAQQLGLLILRPDGNDEITDISVPFHYQWHIFGDYAYSIGNYKYSELQCINIHTGESWVLNDETDVFAAEITTDGNDIYTRDYHPKKQACWEIIKDETGKPTKAVLVTEKI